MGAFDNLSSRMTQMSFAAARVNIKSYAFLIFLFILSSLWIQTASFGLNKSFAQTYTNLSTNIILPLIIFNIILAIWLSKSVPRDFPFIKFIGENSSIPIVLIISLALGSLLFISPLQIPLRTQSIAVFEETPSEIQNQFNSFVAVMNFAFVPSINEEIFWFLMFINLNLFFTMLFNPKLDPNRQLVIFIAAFSLSIAFFAIWHYDKAIKEIEFDWQNYQTNPTLWLKENAGSSPPPNPASTEAFQPFIQSMLWLISFKVLNSFAALFFGSFWIAVLVHYLNNAGQLLVVVSYGLGFLALPHVLLIFAFMILLLVIERNISGHN